MNVGSDNHLIIFATGEYFGLEVNTVVDTGLGSLGQCSYHSWDFFYVPSLDKSKVCGNTLAGDTQHIYRYETSQNKVFNSPVVGTTLIFAWNKKPQSWP